MRKETEMMMRERERIEREKQELLRQQQQQGRFDATTSEELSLPSPVPVSARLGPKVDSDSEGKWSHALDSVLQAPGGNRRSTSQPQAKPGSILPGASSFEDLEAMIHAEKRRKRDQMKERNKGFVRPKQW